MPCFVARRSLTESRARGGLAVFQTNAGHDTYALRLDEDLPFFTLCRANLIAKIIIGAQEPATIPTGCEHCLRSSSPPRRCNIPPVFVLAQNRSQRDHLFGRQNKKAGDKHGFGHFALFAGCRLKRFSRFFGKGVQIETVIPIGTAD